MTVDLTARFGGIEIKNPIMGGASPVTQIPDICEKGAKAGAAGLIMKTNFMEVPESFELVGHPCYRLADVSGLEPWRPTPPKKSGPLKRGKKGIKQPPYGVVIMNGIYPGPDFWRGDNYIDHYKQIIQRVGEDCLVVPSIYAATEKEWENQCRRVREMKARAVHLNLGCPIIAGWPGLQLADYMKNLFPFEPPGSRPEITYKITKLCVENLDIPVIVKMHPFSFANVEVALAVQEAGGKGIEFADSNAGPMLRIDPETAMPGWHPDFPVRGGTWGSWIIQHNCGNIFRIRRAGVKIDITASGGVTTLKDILRYIMVGASSVTVVRTIMVEGWSVVTDWLEELPEWMEKKGYKSIDAMRGIAADRVAEDPTKLQRELPKIRGGQPHKEIVYAEEKCISCGWCVESCMYCAISMVDSLITIDKEKCGVCGMCESICPVGAIRIQQI